MWLEAFNRQQKRRFHHFVWLAAVFLVVAALMIQWHQVNEKAEQIRLKVLVQTFYKSASSLRQQWELQGKPKQAEQAGIRYRFTRLGWPQIVRHGEIDCRKTWELLASRAGTATYSGLLSKSNMRTIRYNSCYYQVSDGKWLELFYENETIRINVFLTGKMSRF